MRFELGKSIVFIPFGVLLFCQPSVASRLGTRLSEVALAVVDPVTQVTHASAAFDPFATELLPGSAVIVADEEGAEADLNEDGAAIGAPNGTSTAKERKAATNHHGKAGAAVKGKPLPSVRVSQAAVLRLAQAGRRPTGVPVAASGNRPAGIQVFGVSALGIGVRDGDVLTHVSEVPVTQAGQVVAMVIAARGARKPVITGRLWRGNRSYSIVVEQPYTRESEEKTANQAALSVDELSNNGTHLERF